MVKYKCITLKVKNGELEGFDELRQREQNSLRNGDVVYIYKGTKSKRFTLDKRYTLLREIRITTMVTRKNLI